MDKPKVDARRTWWDISDDTEPYGTAYWDEKGRRVTKNLAGANSRVIPIERFLCAVQRRRNSHSLLSYGFIPHICGGWA